MGLMSSNQWEKVNEPWVNKEITKKEKALAEMGKTDKFRKAALELGDEHPLYEKARLLLKEYKTVDDIPWEVFEEISDKTGYEEGLIKTVTEIESERIWH